MNYYDGTWLMHILPYWLFQQWIVKAAELDTWPYPTESELNTVEHRLKIEMQRVRYKTNQ